MIRTIAAGVILSASLATASIAGPIDPATVMELELFATIDDPVGIASAPGDFSRVFVYSNTGVIYVVRDGVLLPDPFLDISSEINSSGEKGFFSLVFHPDYQANGTFFIQYTPFFNVDLVLEKVQRLNADQA
ncbi:PQQ-dependent sugar dehydrogenase, partial [Planctomycetaceae bacterium AH-315-I19]|nr:PQQ-dependent sugar dehydrogenase [Planctomycetaceae bacterium AH-315-I19]